MGYVKAPLGPVADWVFKEDSSGVGYGNFYDLVSGAYATVTRADANATYYDARAGKILPVAANKIPGGLRTDAGAMGAAGVIEEARTNLFLSSYVPDVTASARWSMAGTGTTTLCATAHGFYSNSKGIQIASTGATACVYQALATAATGTYAISAYAWRPSGGAIAATSVRVMAVAATTFSLASVAYKTPTVTLTTLKGPTGQPVYRLTATATILGNKSGRCIGFGVSKGQTYRVDCVEANAAAAFSTSWIPTAGSTANRAALSVSLPTTGFGVSAMSFLAVCSSPTTANAMVFGLPTTGGSKNTVTLGVTSPVTSILCTARGADTTNVLASKTGGSASAWQTIGLTMGANLTAYLSGAAGTPQATDANDAVNANAYIGSSSGTGSFWGGSIQRVTCYASELAAADVSTATNAVSSGPKNRSIVVLLSGDAA